MIAEASELETFLFTVCIYEFLGEGILLSDTKSTSKRDCWFSSLCCLSWNTNDGSYS